MKDEKVTYRISLLGAIIGSLLAPALTGPARAQVNAQDSLALVAFYNATDGPHWSTNTNWLTEPVPLWYGVSVTGGRVTRLYLVGNQLKGAIPPELGDLTGLFILNLSSNQLSGNIPPGLGMSSSLYYLNLSSNQLSGNIPPELGSLTGLVYVYLNNNQLNGVIPPELGNLEILEELYLNDNQLNGAIPPQLSALYELIELYLNNNQLNGSIPPELKAMFNLQVLDISNNQLSGAIPPEVGQLPTLTYLFLNDNQLSGAIPPELGDLGWPEAFELRNNQLSGQVPLPVAQAGALADGEDGCDFRGNDALFFPKVPAYQLLASTICGLPLREVLWFEDSPPGTVLSEANAGSGFGPIAIQGKIARCSYPAAVVFDSAHPSGEDYDLGTPNQTFGGPGIGSGGEAGTPWANDAALGNMLILHQDCDDLADGVVETPDDTEGRGRLSLRFPTPVTLFSYTVIDNEEADRYRVSLLGGQGVILSQIIAPATGSNGKAVVVANTAEGISGVLRMVVDRTGSVGLDNIVFSLDEEVSKQAEVRGAIPPGEGIGAFALEAAYPNPFNPWTTIQYTLPEQAQVRLVVYDLQGRERAVLVSSEQPAGRYEVPFDAEGLPSGMYLYRLTAGAYRATRTMILLR